MKGEGKIFMARLNVVLLLGTVLIKPRIIRKPDGTYIYGMTQLNVLRGNRKIGNHTLGIKADNPTVISKDPDILQKWLTWETGDIVEIKGTIATTPLKKKLPVCENCGKEDNIIVGTLVYVNPISVEKWCHPASMEDAQSVLVANREISNSCWGFGTLVRDPKRLTPTSGLVVTQYQIAMNRKYRIRTDPPEIKTDYPWVKAYGETAEDNWRRLHVGSEIYFDGYLQARNVNRHTKCENCGSDIEWKDRAIEIVPYENAIEYIGEYYSDKEIAAREEERQKQAREAVFGRKPSGVTEEEIRAGIDPSAS